MKTLVIFYSLTGNTKRIAEGLAAKESYDIAEAVGTFRPGPFKALVLGSFAARGLKAWAIKPLDADISAYERLMVLAPIWAGFPVPFINSVIAGLPEGKTVSFKAVSASGKSSCKERVEAAIKAKGCTLESFEDIKA